MATGWAAGASAPHQAGLPSSHACLVERAWPSRYARPPIRRQRYKAALPGVFASAGRSGRFIKRNSFGTTTHLPIATIYMPTLLATALYCATDPVRAPLTTAPEAMQSEQRVRLIYPYVWHTHAHPPCVIWTRRCGHAVDCTAIASLLATGWAAGASAPHQAGLPSSHACLDERARVAKSICAATDTAAL